MFLLHINTRIWQVQLLINGLANWLTIQLTDQYWFDQPFPHLYDDWQFCTGKVNYFSTQWDLINDEVWVPENTQINMLLQILIT